MIEFEHHGKLSDPKEKEWVKAHCYIKSDGVYRVLLLEQEEFLLSLLAKDPIRPNQSYVQELYLHYKCIVSSTFISKWFKNQYEFEGDSKGKNGTKNFMCICNQLKKTALAYHQIFTHSTVNINDYL